MKKWLWRVILLAAVLAVGWFGWRRFFPPPETVIRKRLTELAKSASFTPNESPLAQGANLLKATSFLKPDVVVTIDVRGQSQQTYTDRDTLMLAAGVLRQALGSLQVEFVDMNVAVAPDKKAAVVNLTAKGKTRGDLQVQELKFTMEKINGDWLISRIETVKTLSRQTSPMLDEFLASAASTGL
jgi:hypothetical protein